MAQNRANAPAAPDAPDSTTPPAPDLGAGTSDANAPAAPDVVADEAPAAVPAVAHDPKDAEIFALRAQLAAAQAQGALSQIQAAQQPAPATFTAPSAPLIGKYDSVTGLVQQLPDKLWDLLSDEDKERFTPYVADKPEALATA